MHNPNHKQHKTNQKKLDALAEDMRRDHIATGAETEADFMRLGYSKEQLVSVRETYAQLMRAENAMAA